MRVSQKISLISLVAILLLIGASTSSFLQSQRLIAHIESIQNERAIPLAQLKGISDAYAVNVIDALNKAYLADEQNLGAVFKQIDQTIEQANSQWNNYVQNVVTADEQRLAEMTQQHLFNVVSELQSRQSSLQAERLTLRDLIITTYQDVDALSLSIDALIDLQLDVVDDIHYQALTAEDKYNAIRVLYVLFGFSAFALLSYKIVTSITRLLGAEPEVISQYLQQMASGEFRKFDTDSSKATGVFASLTQMANRQHELLNSTHGIANNVAAAAEELSCVMAETAKNAEQEKVQLESVNTALAQLSSTVGEMVSNTENAESAAVKAADSVQEGSLQLQRSVNLTNSIERSIYTTAEVLQKLKNETQNIEEVVDVINQISEQTNLLALNAAIEAARAGQQGRGFAVVADQVRNLAAKTQHSTQRIRDMIASFQQQADVANNNMQQNKEMIENSVVLTSAVEVAFSDIQASVASLSEINASVAYSSQEQLAVTKEVSERASTIVDLVNLNVSAVVQTQQSSSELAQLANQQKEDLSFFKLS
ncbi:methyl-accepting chemotaxis protein [Vibrio astriarenae]